MVGLFLSGLRAASPAEEAKSAALESIERHSEEMIEISAAIWAYAETALREKKSAALLADRAAQHGFAVERGVAGMPTAFVASYGAGKPVIAVLGEYDALPGLSQKAQTTREALEEGAPGHGCGHNLFGSASLGAAISVKELIEAGRLSGTVRFYGTPAEETVGGKVYMARDGLFDDVDVVLAWHPDYVTRADTASSQAMVDFVVEFHGEAAHAAYDPWNARSALDGVELFTFALNQLREHVRPTVRMHYVIQDGGDVPNVVPARASTWVWIRDSRHESVDELLERARDIAQGAALATGTQAEIRIQAGSYEMLPNFTGAALLHENLEVLGQLAFSDEEQEFARQIQRATGTPEVGLRTGIEPLELEPGEPEGGSTDVADVSWAVPTIHLLVATAPEGAGWHAWPVVAAGGMSIGHKGMLYAARALAATMVDLFERPDVVRAIRAEFDEAKVGKEYRAYIPDGPPPVPAD
jgi:aminobenzoyl-glutamate utilization protein B